MSKERKLLIWIIYTAIFMALCFAGTFISIPLGTSKIHLGNFFCILAGLLCGPFIGGLAGSLGMGFNDVFQGYAWNTYLRTFILKFLMGFIVGFLFRLCLKKKANGKILLWITSFLSLCVFGYILYMYFVPDSGYGIVAVIAVSILCGIILIGSIVSVRLKKEMSCLLFSLVISIVINVAGEFFLRILFSMATGISFEGALASSILKLPAALFTSIVTIILVMALFYPLYMATRKLNQLNDLDEYIILGDKSSD